MFRRRQILTAGLATVAASTFACNTATPNTVTIYTSVDQVFAEPVLNRFAEQSGINVKIVFDTEETKSTGLLNRLIAEAQNPRADVFWSGDPVRPQILIRKGIATPYMPATAAGIPDAFKAKDGSWVGFSARARVLLVNTDMVPKGEWPTRVEDLADPKWRGKATMANPAFGTTTMHVAALFATRGSDKGFAFLQRLRTNNVYIASSNGEVKRLVSNGEKAIGLTDTDDASVALLSGAPVAIIYPDKAGLGTLLMPTSAVLMHKAPHPAAARQLIDYLASTDVEKQLAFAPCAQMPLRAEVERPAHVAQASEVSAMEVDYARVGEVMEQIHPFLTAWAEGRPDVTPPIIAPAPSAAQAARK